MKTHKRKHIAVVSWAFIWYGTIFSVQPTPDVRLAGTVLWSIGIGLQMFVGIRFISQMVSTGDNAKPQEYPIAEA